MSKYGPVTEKQINRLIAFMEDHLIHRKFTHDESANMREVLYTLCHTAQLERNFKLLVQLKKNLDEDNASPASKLAASLKKLQAICQPPPF